ncbi:MAG: Stress response protein YhaX [Candidatus Hydrogenedentes bacterium ADurb.Bin101]|nr:MAG: Stress response protein YhaX [Candidatus Hydrogenedentes bacterium ADurb.Bin101]
MNIDLKGVTKGAAVDSLIEQLGLNRESVAGIGDTLGDMSIREAVGFFACPANAVPGLKAVADYVSPFPDVQGMLDIFERPELQRTCRHDTP